MALPVAARDVLSGEELREGAELSLGEWDVRVLVELSREENNEEGRPLE
jgi:predicted component of type VI protein secretion system